MRWLLGEDWESVFLPTTPVLEIVVRGTVMYLVLFLILRLVLKREAGGIGISDMLVVVLVADAAQNGMADDYRSVTDGVLLVGVIVGWAWALDRVAYRFPWVRSLVKPPALLLVRHGRVIERNMNRESVTEDDLRTAMRVHGIDDIHRVKEAWMEGDGRISIVPFGEEGRRAS